MRFTSAACLDREMCGGTHRRTLLLRGSEEKINSVRSLLLLDNGDDPLACASR